ncbi:helix-turn-helix domain-containing protein [Pusillimonas sp.]|uniref:helix-turn-helix domain-containing protein n=1 Tax=Pusillimonas sp. TaxID=3040095 RepID=UPI0037CBADAC
MKAKRNTVAPLRTKQPAPSPQESPISSEEIAVCARLKALRINSGLTLDVLAERSGFTKGYLSKIENGKSAPPIASLARIARAMNQELSYFFVDPIQNEDSLQPVLDPRISVVHRWERKPVVRGGTGFGYDYVSLAHKKAHKFMEPFIFTFPSEVDIDTYFEHPGEEFIYILAGEVEFEIQIDGHLRRWNLEPGDSMYFESSLPHRGRSRSGDAQALVVVMEHDHQAEPEE